MNNNSLNKAITAIAILLSAVCISSCATGYDAEICRSLSEKVNRHEKFDQKEYHEMIAQYNDILSYMIAKTEQLSAIPDNFERREKADKLKQDPEYMERFNYMLTLGSVLYRADVNSLLDMDNKLEYDHSVTMADKFTSMSHYL